MAYLVTTATKKILKTNKRIRLLAGGMRASKTISVLMYLITCAQSDKTPTLTSVVSESFPHLSRGAIRDFESIMTEQGYWKQKSWNKTNSIYTFETGSKIEFFSVDVPAKVRGPSRDRLFVNEANNVSRETWEQLLFRTRQFAFADWNPVGDFYLYEDYGLDDEDGAFTNDDRVDFLIMTYKDNEALEPAIVEDIERKAELNPNWRRVYADGKRGSNDSKIFKDWKIINTIPHEAKLVRYGLDFGYTNDPTAIIAIYYYNGGYILDEITYQKGLSNKQIADILNNQPKALVMADSAEPKSIDEIKLYGVNVLGTVKGKDSVNQGIQYVQDQQISITKHSTYTIDENRRYMWLSDKDGEVTNVPMETWNHAMDAIRYGFESLRPRKEREIRPRPERLRFTV